MGATIVRWGNSLAVRLPKDTLDAASLREGDQVTVSAEHGNLVLRRADQFDVKALIGAISPLNLPDESFDFARVGRELL